ncbi:MAG: 2Fe-2S iron-sulfur cluster-binding protein [Myxococcota bacterium]|nr:2Fe-2S iron-sulfur cluster-binding protein [Myxococcota bacterium]
MSTMEIDRQRVTLREGETVLQTARRHGFDVPTLCHHEALEPVGACRLCLVEVWLPGWSATEPGKLVASCLYPSSPGLVVATGSDRVRATRKTVFELLLARAPRSRELVELAARHGVVGTPYPPTDAPDDCILCGQCTRICELLGHTAIATVGRGVVKEVAPPLRKPPLACVGCGACARVCPTRTIPMVETATSREIWGRVFELVPCEVCGKRHLTREQITFFSARTGLDGSYFRTCDDCSRKETVARLAAQVWAGQE